MISNSFAYKISSKTILAKEHIIMEQVMYFGENIDLKKLSSRQYQIEMLRKQREDCINGIIEIIWNLNDTQKLKRIFQEAVLEAKLHEDITFMVALERMISIGGNLTGSELQSYLILELIKLSETFKKQYRTILKQNK